jgi:hypothetical protein
MAGLDPAIQGNQRRCLRLTPFDKLWVRSFKVLMLSLSKHESP